MDNPEDREKSIFWQGFAAGFVYFLFILLLEIFVGPYLTDAEAGGLPIAVTALLVWICSTKEDAEQKIFKAGTFILAAILTPFIYELLAPLGKINPVLQILPALLIAFGISIGIGFAILAAVKKH
jgi:hypothetical protein